MNLRLFFRFLLILTILLPALTACTPEDLLPLLLDDAGAGGESTLPQAAPAQSDSAPPSITVYFTDTERGSLRGGTDANLAAAIDAAQLSVDIAAYDFDLWSVRDALINAHRRGVQVRMVTESNYIENPEVQDLLDAGIEVIGDRIEGLMHHKFVVIDGQEVWTGSMNLNLNAAYRNNENYLRILSPQLAENYEQEFEEMFTEDRFGPNSRYGNTPNPTIEVDGITIENYFAPDDRPAARIVELLEGAQESIVFMAFSFTRDDFAKAMLARAKAGVTVRGVFESEQVNSNGKNGEYGTLRAAGLDVHRDGNPRTMHHKVIIIDERIVITGSYNFSSSAEERNDENLLIICSPEIAAQFLQEFERVYAQAEQ
ncbi:MAG: hypothetical protein OHK0052_01640 [Anaerolineales bacterium]